MAVREVLVVPDKRLRRVAEPVATIDTAIQALIADLIDTMYAAAGIGLAAIQIGEPWRVVVIDLTNKDEPRQPRVFINPEVTWHSEEAAIHTEGCLSIPASYEEVRRPAFVRVRHLDRNGAQREIEASGLLATCLQHEIEHLDGKLFIDHLSRLRRDRAIKRLVKTRRHSAKSVT